MPVIIKGKHILNALTELKAPSNLTEIVEHLLAIYDGSKDELLKTVEATLAAGTQYGYIEVTEDKYHISNESANDDKDQVQQNKYHTNADINKNPELDDTVKKVMSVNQLNNSSDSLVTTKKKRSVAEAIPRMKFDLQHFDSSDDDNVDNLHNEECSGTSYRSSRRSRSRSGKRGKRSLSRRSRRRRRM